MHGRLFLMLRLFVLFTLLRGLVCELRRRDWEKSFVLTLVVLMILISFVSPEQL